MFIIIIYFVPCTWDSNNGNYYIVIIFAGELSGCRFVGIRSVMSTLASQVEVSVPRSLTVCGRLFLFPHTLHTAKYKLSIVLTTFNNSPAHRSPCWDKTLNQPLVLDSAHCLPALHSQTIRRNWRTYRSFNLTYDANTSLQTYSFQPRWLHTVFR